MTHYHHHTTAKLIIFPLFSAKEKIDCILVEHFGHHSEKSKDYHYCYKQEIFPVYSEGYRKYSNLLIKRK